MNHPMLRKRTQELMDHCDRQNLNWKERLKGLPGNDDRLTLAALATSLGFSLRGAFDPSKSLAELESEKKISQEESKQLDDLRRRLAP
jgi:hypothetical protein